jgi:hypothetical protein
MDIGEEKTVDLNGGGDGCAKPNKKRLFGKAKNLRELSLFLLHFGLIDLIRPDTENHRTWCDYDEVSLESQS